MSGGEKTSLPGHEPTSANDADAGASYATDTIEREHMALFFKGHGRSADYASALAVEETLSDDDVRVGSKADHGGRGGGGHGGGGDPRVPRGLAAHTDLAATADDLPGMMATFDSVDVDAPSHSPVSSGARDPSSGERSDKDSLPRGVTAARADTRTATYSDGDGV